MNFLSLETGLGLAQKQMQQAQMIQAMEIIQKNALDLDLYLQNEVELNPLLEISENVEENISEEENVGIRDEDEFCFDESKMDAQAALEDGFEASDELSSDETFSERNEEKRNYAESLRSYSKTIEDSLKEQIIDMDLPNAVQKTALYLLGDLDENGFLCINENLYDSLNLDAEIIDSAKKAIQNCEPAGIGASNLKESLLLQLEKQGYDDSDLIFQIIDNCWDLFLHGKITTIARKFEVEPIEIQEAIQIVKQLSLSPAKDYKEDSADLIVPDLIVRYIDKAWKVAVNDTFLPNLEINQQYSDMLKKQFKTDKDTKSWIRDKFNKANWLIKAVEQRRVTMIRTMHAIIKHQSNFFTTENAKRSLLPMNLKDISDETGLHESTISRVTNNKFVITPFGTFELKYFFSEVVLSKQNEDGEDVSTTKIKEVLKQLIEDEDKSQPLSDQLLSEKLEEIGLTVARRTIAKYREQLGFATARLRKRY